MKQHPGTELKRLLRRFAITNDCDCEQHAKRMDQQGPQWCRKNIELITDWLEEEAEKRSLPFIRSGAKVLIKLAIRRAERSETCLK